MKKRICFLLALLILISALGLQWTVADAIIPGEDAVTTEEKIDCNATLEDNFADDRVLVVLNNAASTSLKTYALTDFTGYGFKSVTNLTSATTALANAKLRGQPIPEEFATNSNVLTFEDFYDVNLETFNQILCLELKTPGKQNVLNAIKVLEKHPDVKYAGPDYYMTLFSGETNDTYVDDQWALDMIDLPEAWAIASDRTVKVGVLDSAVDIGHPDISGSMYQQEESDLPGSGNYFDCMGDDSRDPNYEGHGTMVAGIIAAVINNGEGIAGACSNVELVSLKVCNTYTDGKSSYVVEAIDIAEDEGISILNFSGGFWLSNVNDYTPLYDAIENYNGLFICAAGNHEANIDLPNANGARFFPAVFDLPNLITVGASTEEDSIWNGAIDNYGSNYGATSVDPFAPGEGIISCYLRNVCSDSCDTSIHQAIGYHKSSGTSFAAPYVTAVAAMILAKYPAHSISQIVDRIRLSVDKAYIDNTYVYDNICKWKGRLNAYKALHDHDYTITNLTSTQHEQTCDCEVVKISQHLWQTETLVLPGGQTLIIEVCSVCGYQS